MSAAPELPSIAVGDGLLLFDPQRVRAHGLNASAALVWRTVEAMAREEGTADPRTRPCDADAVARRVADAVGGATAAPGPATIRTQVADVVDHLVREGLVGGGHVGAEHHPDPTALPRATFGNVPFTAELAPSREDIAWAHRSGPYRGLDVVFRLACDDADLGTYLARALAPLRLRDLQAPTPAPPEPDRGTTAVRRYEVVARDRLLVLDDHVVARPGSDRSLAALVLWHVNQLVSETSSQWLLHASAVVPAGGSAAVLFPAHMNSGKSTLAAALVSAGHGYVTDETVAVDLATSQVVPYPKAIALDPGSWPLLPHLAPDPDPRLDRFAHDKWYCDVEDLRPGAAVHTPVPVGAVVFPTYDPTRPTELTVVPPLEAAVELAQNSFNLVTVGQAGLMRLAELAETRPCYRLLTHDLPSALAALAPLLAEAMEPRR